MNDDITGQRIVEIRPMTREELENEYWEADRNIPPVLVLENGVKIYPSRDVEGNGPGMLFGTSIDGTSIYVGIRTG